MPIRGCQTKILIDEWDLSGQSNSVGITADVAVLDYVTFQNCYQQRVPGLPMSAIQHNGYFSGPGAGEMEEELHARLGSGNDVIVGVILGTSLAAPVGYCLRTAFGQQLRLNAPVAELLTVEGNWTGNTAEGLQRGLQVAFATAEDSTGAVGSGADFGAAGSAGGRAFLFLQDIEGTATDAEILIESDSASNFGTAATEGTFTVSAVGGYSVALSGTVGRYIRANINDLGGADSLTFLIVVCVEGVTQ